ncbi:YihY/virulence factor BrkB family protein [Halotalea alkalilenta]|uniref:Uncharacterized protein n=1 Tax=Halotalea alkalilenta TaxID=376489 RepID=A0A172YIK0_9GAMM|nr:YihY/virulence factor BrkB family protein [Halotalea alkalilenta]ANF58982.1 hypothetical protein A5892_17195 [Halotalea alkalilenta]
MEKSRRPLADTGQTARSPLEIPRAGWKQVLLRLYYTSEENHTSLVASGIAFYSLLGLFPAIAALISIWGLVSDPAQVEQQFALLNEFIPADAANMITAQARSVSASAGAGMSLTAIFGLLLTLYSASKGVKTFMEGLNIIYGEKEDRSIIKRTLLNLGLTLGMILMVIVTLFCVAVLPILFSFLPFAGFFAYALYYVRWLLLLGMITLAIAVLYRFAPNRKAARWEWLSIGTIVATVLWIAASIGFSIYVSNFGSYNETYGSIGAVIVVLMWFWLSAYIVLLGAGLNCELERQTSRDSTVGPAKPLGRRGAYAADSVAGDESQPS